MTMIYRYWENLRQIMERAFETQKEALERAARAVCDCATSGHMLYTFGTGHAHMLAEELFYRAGGLAAVMPVLDEKLMLHVSASQSTEWERREGYAEALLDDCGLGRGDVLIVCSNSGRNAVPVEMAVLARERGATVIALTNVRHSQSVSPRNSRGLRLMEAADVVLDNGGCVGDASMDVGIGRNVGATSTAVGAALLEAMVCRCVELAVERGRKIDVYSSSNVDAGDAINEAIVSAYRARIRCL